MEYTLRDYQEECVETINETYSGSHLIQLATGLGKTVVFTSPKINRYGRLLILAHHEELVRQPITYYAGTGISTGIEMAGERSNGEEVISASVLSMVNRLDRFDPEDFDIIVTDECHHAAAKSYREIYKYFKPRLHLGFTATPMRGDHVRLDDIFSDIIYQRDLLWGIKNHYLSDIFCQQANIGYDLSTVHMRNGDFAPNELGEAMDHTADAIAEAYYELHKGPTLIFASSVNHAKEIASRIGESAIITGKTPTQDRERIISEFKAGKIECLVNVMVFTEGIDLPMIETIIIARPTMSYSLYSQMVGRGMRLYDGKERLNLIDCVGATGKHNLCTAPTLQGIDMSIIPERLRSKVQGEFFDLNRLAKTARGVEDTPESYLKSVEVVNIWAKEYKFNTHGVMWMPQTDGSMYCQIKEGIPPFEISAVDYLGNVKWEGRQVPIQVAMDEAYSILRTQYADSAALWNSKCRNRGSWTDPISPGQINYLKILFPNFTPYPGMTKSDADILIKQGKRRKRR